MPSPSITTLLCRCFFRGREFIAAPDCEEHGEEPDEWQCKECGETAMDGGTKCITCGADIED